MTETFGAYLKRERELRQISLEEISEQTNIRKDYLEAMESDQLEKLPGLTFTQGYLKAYGNYIGLEPGDVIVHFEKHINRISKLPEVSKKAHRPVLFWLLTFSFLILIALGILQWFPK